MLLVTVILIAILILIIQIYQRESYVSSRIDKKDYKVLSKFSDTQEAADKLAMINNKNRKLIQYMVEQCNVTGEDHGCMIADRLQDRYRDDRLQENDPVDKNNTSFTEDKGAKVALCLREKTTGQDYLHDDNILEFVNLHEMAHIASQGYGHEDEFWNNFERILHAANQAGLHEPRDYAARPIQYCGLDVSYNPFFDKP